jgi:uncharacterized membrane protein
VLRRSPGHQDRYRQARRHLPWIVLYYLFVSLGVMLGNLFGLAQMDVLFMDYELNQDRIVITEAA